MYPIGFPRHPNKIGIFLAGKQAADQENQSELSHLRFRLTLINQHNPEKSIAAGNSSGEKFSASSLALE